MNNAIEVRGLRKTFGEKVAVDALDLAVPRGSLYGFIGPNGAGKTTTIRMIMSIIFPDEGELQVLGKRSALEAKDRIGYLPEERGVYRKMKVGAYLRYVAGLKGVEPNEARRRMRAWLERVGLGEVERKRNEELSKGMQQKVQFIAAVIHEPELLILDEPFSGLDPANTILLRELIEEQHRRGATVIFSTHVMFQAEQLCERVFMIHNGRKALDDTLRDLRARFDPKTLVFEPLDPAANPAPLEALPFVREVRRLKESFELSLADDVPPSEVLPQVAAVMPAAKVELRRPSLEDIFIEIVMRGDSSTARQELRAALRDEPAVEGAR